MDNIVTPFSLFIVASLCACLLAVTVPFALWYYFRAKEIAPLLTKKAALESVLENLTKDIHAAREQLDKMAEDVASAKDKIAERNIALQWLEEHKKEIIDIAAQITKLKAEYEGVLQQLQDVQKRVSDRQLEFAELNKRLEEAEEKMTNLKQTHKDAIEKLELLKEELKKDVSQLSADKGCLQSEKESLSKQVNELRSEREQLRARVEKLDKELKDKKDALAKASAEYEVQRRKGEELNKENASLIAKLDGMRQNVTDAESVIARANTLKNNEASIWKDLERPIAAIEEEPIRAKPETDERKALMAFKRGLDESGYSFNERTIKAFHTGLLCGGVSPLVVLSGISGTGKSLLPELYAKAFGMNFLPVAVQPRWDGPQDVFGFYNHMEGRFKATELSRLLWQFDRFNNPRAAKEYSEENWGQFPMSLVLLDEMNLARVEYYFSELLSKLEIRNRVIDPDDQEARVASEVELEYGASSVTDARVAEKMARRLFVGQNILFVGTMNEDESTQTLSNKVIDRANVLRFGTPESLLRAPDEKKFLESCNNFVSYKTWLTWAKPCGSAVSEIDEYIKTLKEALKKVERGFGHRTERAIKQYVQFYPGDKQDALADQIEMKILPKLNGVDADLVRDKVRVPITEVLAAIRDTEVTEALNQTLQSESTFFNWKGVRR